MKMCFSYFLNFTVEISCMCNNKDVTFDIVCLRVHIHVQSKVSTFILTTAYKKIQMQIFRGNFVYMYISKTQCQSVNFAIEHSNIHLLILCQNVALFDCTYFYCENSNNFFASKSSLKVIFNELFSLKNIFIIYHLTVYASIRTNTCI